MLLTLVVLATGLTGVSAQDEVTVETSLGAVTGVSSEGVDAFLGIQYATVGERFSQSTLLVEPQNSIINATFYGPFCYQSVPPYFAPEWGVYELADQEEECLYLNIWRPSNASDPLATMVWIHGGGFVIGSGAEPAYVGAKLARDQNVVVVTINYRLGIFGFLPTDDSGTGGLNGIYDQIQALTWVQNHISSFGGDPSQVTVFGESAGSGSVCMLSVSPLAKGLFQRAILQSGECVFSPFMMPNMPEKGAVNLQTILNATGALSVEELANLPAEDIKGVSSLPNLFLPTVDGTVLPKHPRELHMDSSNIIPTETVVGSNSYDSPMAILVAPEPFIGMASNMATEIQQTFPEQADAITKAYSPENYNGSEVAAYAQYQGDVFFRCAAREFAASISDKITTYLYNYAHLSAVDPVVLNGLLTMADVNDTSWASHAAEIPMVMGTPHEWESFFGFDSTSDVAATTPDADVALSQELMARWANFATNGIPNTNEYDGWEPVSSGTSSTQIPTFLLKSGGGIMSSVDEKVEQCSTFPFVASAPTDDGATDDGDTSFAERRAKGSVLLVMCIGVFAMLSVTV